MTETPQNSFEAMEREAAAAASANSRPAAPPRLPMSGLQKNALRISVFLSLLCPVWLAAAGLGVKFGLWDYKFGLLTMTMQIAPMLIMAAIAVAVIALIIQLIRSPRRGALIAFVALCIPGLIMGRMLGLRMDMQGIPPIHDIQTDWDDQVHFPDALIELRKANGWNPVLENPTVPDAFAARWPNAAGRSNRELQAEAYAEFNLKPVLLEIPPAETLGLVELVAMRQGWKIESVDEAAGILYATQTSVWYGFTDDIVVRVRPQGPVGARVDIRSTSRVGLSDMGANATRIKGFVDDMVRATKG